MVIPPFPVSLLELVEEPAEPAVSAYFTLILALDAKNAVPLALVAHRYVGELLLLDQLNFCPFAVSAFPAEVALPLKVVAVILDK